MVKTLLLGVDAADPDLVEEYDLPNITGLSSEGDGFEVRTHANSGPSWSSLMTGLLPAEHGVFKLSPGQDRHSWGGTPIWEKIDGYCGIANVPLTYPPAELNGWMVSGVMTPRRSIYTYPPELYRDLDERGYRIDMWTKPGINENHPNGAFGMVPSNFDEEWREEAIDQIYDVIEKRGKCFRWLLEEYTPVDFAFLCFTSLDRGGHIAFHRKDDLERMYRLVDEQIGRILDSDVIDDSVEIYLVSDHGMEDLDRPGSDITGDHRPEGYGISNTGETWRTLEECHRRVVESANRTDVKGRLEDLGYLE